MYDFAHFDQVVEAVETLSPDAVDAGELIELAYFSGAMAREWELCKDRLQIELLLAASHAGIEADIAWYDIRQGLADGLEATKAFCILRASHPMKQAEQ